MLQWRMWLGGYLRNLTCMFMRVCGWVHARVCFLFSLCSSKSSDFFFFFCFFLVFFFNCVITRFLTPRLKKPTASPVPWTSYLSKCTGDIFILFCFIFLQLEALDLLWSASRDSHMIPVLNVLHPPDFCQMLSWGQNEVGTNGSPIFGGALHP